MIIFMLATVSQISEMDANEITGNGNYVNLLKNLLGKVKSLQMNLFLVDLSHLKPLCLTLIAWPTLTTVSLTL